MKYSEMFPGRFLKALDLQGRTVNVTIADHQLEDVGGNGKAEHRPVLSFEGKDRGLVLNKTNASVLAEAFGDDGKGWIGQSIELFPTTTPFQGKVVDCIRIRIPTQPDPPKQNPTATETVDESDIPF